MTKPCKNCGQDVEKDADGDYKGLCEDCIENAEQQIEEEMAYGEGRRGSRRRGSRRRGSRRRGSRRRGSRRRGSRRSAARR